jgi:hypothetical protein
MSIDIYPSPDGVVLQGIIKNVLVANQWNKFYYSIAWILQVKFAF